MVTDTYARILDKNRRTMAKKFEKSFYEDNGDEQASGSSLEQVISYCLQNPEALEVLRNLLVVTPT